MNCFELYNNEQLDESLSEVNDLVDYFNSALFDESERKYKTAYNHILCSTYAFIGISKSVDYYKEVNILIIQSL